MLGKLYCKQVSNNKQAIKYLWDIDNKVRIGAVLFYLPNRKIKYSICTSTQAGCVQGCKFCAAGNKEFYRNLTQDEIIKQVEFIINDNPVINEMPFEIALMATGEPFLNYDNVMHSISEIKSKCITLKQVNLSTIGIISGIKKFEGEDFKDLNIKLQVSLHHPEDALRDALMPSKAKGSIKELLEAGKDFSKKRSQKVSLNLLLLTGFNDDNKTIHKLIELVAPYKDFFYIKLSRLNETETNHKFYSPGTAVFENIQKAISSRGIKCKIFFGEGNDVAGNCGQLFLTG